MLREEQDDSESMDGDFEGLEEPEPVLKVWFNSLYSTISIDI